MNVQISHAVFTSQIERGGVLIEVTITAGEFSPNVAEFGEIAQQAADHASSLVQRHGTSDLPY